MKTLNIALLGLRISYISHEIYISHNFRMVRSYKRTTQRSAYSHDILIEYLNAVRNKTMSLREACRNFSIPRSTIQKRLKSQNPDGVKQLGPIRRVFTDEMEMELKSRVPEMESTFYRATWQVTLLMTRTANVCTVQNCIAVPKAEKNGYSVMNVTIKMESHRLHRLQRS